MKKPVLLVVEDSDEMQLTLRQIFERLGCAVVSAMSAEEALSSLKQGPRPDVIILDFKLPKMSGPELFRHLAMDPGLKPIPVVPFSSYVGEGLRDSLVKEWQAVARAVEGGRPAVPRLVPKEPGTEHCVPEQLILTVGTVLKSSPAGMPAAFESAVNELVARILSQVEKSEKNL